MGTGYVTDFEIPVGERTHRRFLENQASPRTAGGVLVALPDLFADPFLSPEEMRKIADEVLRQEVDALPEVRLPPPRPGFQWFIPRPIRETGGGRCLHIKAVEVPGRYARVVGTVGKDGTLTETRLVPCDRDGRMECEVCGDDLDDWGWCTECPLSDQEERRGEKHPHAI
jgi:hypothetical protein